MPGWSGKTRGWSPHVESWQSLENINVGFTSNNSLLGRVMFPYCCIFMLLFYSYTTYFTHVTHTATSYYFISFCTDYSTEPICLCLFYIFALLSHLKRFPFAWIWVFHFLYAQLLTDYGELLSLVDQVLFELLLGLGLQKLLSEGNVGEHRGKCSTEFNGRLGAFLERRMRKLKICSANFDVIFQWLSTFNLHSVKYLLDFLI